MMWIYLSAFIAGWALVGLIASLSVNDPIPAVLFTCGFFFMNFAFKGNLDEYVAKKKGS